MITDNDPTEMILPSATKTEEFFFGEQLEDGTHCPTTTSRSNPLHREGVYPRKSLVVNGLAIVDGKHPKMDGRASD